MHYLLNFGFCFGTWLLFSGLFDAFHLTLGVISSIMVSLFSTQVLFQEDKSPGQRIKEIGRFTYYFVWLQYQIVLANLHVFYLAVHPQSRKKIEPKIVVFKTKLKTNFARFVLANSITLTPGTVTVKIVGDEFFVHAISRKVTENLPGEMEDRIAHVFEK